MWITLSFAPKKARHNVGVCALHKRVGATWDDLVSNPLKLECAVTIDRDCSCHAEWPSCKAFIIAEDGRGGVCAGGA